MSLNGIATTTKNNLIKYLKKFTNKSKTVYKTL